MASSFVILMEMVEKSYAHYVLPRLHLFPVDVKNLEKHNHSNPHLYSHSHQNYLQLLIDRMTGILPNVVRRSSASYLFSHPEDSF